MPSFTVRLKANLREACNITVASLFIIPLIHFSFLQFSFTQGKELTFKTIVIIGALALLIKILKKEQFQAKAIGNSTLFILLLAQLTLHAVSNFMSETPLVALYGTFSRGEGFIFDLYLFAFLLWNATFLSSEKIQTVLKWFWASTLIVAIYAILQKLGIEIFFQNYSTNLFQGRVFSFLGNPSLLGQLMLLSLLVGVYLLSEARSKKQKLIFGGGTLLMLGTVFLSGTRSAVLALMGIAVLGILKYRKEIWKILKRIRLKFLLLLPVLVILIWAGPSGRFNLSELSLRSLYSRFEIWEGTVSLIQEKWLLGYGQETFYIHFPEIVTKEFLTLEEDVNISADRVHNEWLEEMYSHGVAAGILYLLLLGFLLKKFFISEKKEEVILAGLIVANALQNQLSFPDASISVVIAFAWGALVALESKEACILNPLYKTKKRWALMALALVCILAVAFQTLVRPFVAHRLYTVYQENTENYETAVNALKESLTWAPYYSETWYELMFIDPSSMERALKNLEVIDGESGDVLAWKGNFYAESNPQLSAEYFLQALEKNPSHPNWLRAFGDMLYSEGDCETALYIYNQYLDAVPEYWKWSVDLEEYSEVEQKSYETFFKHAPYFFGTLEKMEKCRANLKL